MGIPAYFAHLIKDYPNIIKSNLEKGIGRVFLDLNCAIHPCCREIIEKFKDEKINQHDLEKKMINNVIQYINTIIEFTQPKELLYISIDGVPPRAKSTQQRLRRFKSVKERNYINEIKNECGITINESWDTNAITPGTLFMTKLSLEIKKYINNINLCEYNIIFSDSNVPGEGEHKILQYIKNNSNDKLYDIIYGLDADLIMLALITNSKNIALLREPVHFQKNIDEEEKNDNKFLYLEINNLKENLLIELFNKLDTKEDFDMISNNLIRDYIFLCMLIGNDFLPHLPSLTIKTGGINDLIDYYTDIRNDLNTNLITDDLTINMNFFENILKKILKNENTNLKQLYKKRNLFKVPPSSSKDYFEEKMHEMNYYPILNRNKEHSLLMGEDNWQERYYRDCFDNILAREYEINRICKNYFDGLNWNIKYYFDKCCSWVWYYKHRHAPSVSDLIKYINSTEFNKITEFNLSQPYAPFNLLMMVLPPYSHNLLPESYKTIYTDISSGITEYYPVDFELDTLNKKFYWECYPILPDINIDKLLTTLSKYKLSISENERNNEGSDILYIKNKNYKKNKKF